MGVFVLPKTGGGNVQQGKHLGVVLDLYVVDSERYKYFIH
jgi:hypothetical protein